jgi:hypothetical protein
MPKSLFRIIAVFLSSCLLADSSVHAAFLDTCSTISSSAPSAFLFNAQALSPVDREFVPAFIRIEGVQQKRLEVMALDKRRRPGLPSGMAAGAWYTRLYLDLRSNAQGPEWAVDRLGAGLVRLLAPSAIEAFKFFTPGPGGFKRFMRERSMVVIAGQEVSYLKLSLRRRKLFKAMMRVIFGPLELAQRVKRRPLAWTLWSLYFPFSFIFLFSYHLVLGMTEALVHLAHTFGLSNIPATEDLLDMAGRAVDIMVWLIDRPAATPLLIKPLVDQLEHKQPATRRFA